MDDYSEITQVVAKERQYRVRHLDKIRECYYPDATVQTSWQKGDLDSFVGHESKEVDPRFPIVGSSATPIIHLKGNKAYVELPTTTYMRMMVKGVEVEIQSFRRLIYRVEKRTTEWRISSMLSINESDNLHPVIPGTEFKVDPAQLKDFRPSYQFLSYVRTQAGGSISNELLGIDRPRDVQKVYQDADEWLAN